MARRRRKRYPKRRMLFAWLLLLLWASPGALVITASVVLVLGGLFAAIWPGLRAGSYYDQLAVAILAVDTFCVMMFALGVFNAQ